MNIFRSFSLSLSLNLSTFSFVNLSFYPYLYINFIPVDGSQDSKFESLDVKNKKIDSGVVYGCQDGLEGETLDLEMEFGISHVNSSEATLWF